jgi:hypothetical protein
MVVKVKHRADLLEGYHWCPSCNVQQVEDVYMRCFSCQRKWRYVYDQCLKYGWPKDLAIRKANGSYPESR